MKRILILVMSCNDSFFLDQESYIYDTWGNEIKKYPNIDLCIYRGGENETSFDKENNILKLRVEDDINNTFKKTYLAFDMVKDIFEYDYIFRVNTSTYVNIQLLNEFIQSLTDDSILWCAELYSLSEAMTPYPLYLFGRGNALLFSKYLVNIILEEGFSYLYFNMTDDNTIGNIINSYWIKRKENYLNHIKSFRHGWYRCIGANVITKNSICQWKNENCSFDFMKTFITIQIKRYWEREKENKNYIDLYNKCFKNRIDDDIENTVKMQYQYSKNPNIFIGSILGYIDYKTWCVVDKNKLYYLETHNKSSDDINRGKAQNLIIL